MSKAKPKNSLGNWLAVGIIAILIGWIQMVYWQSFSVVAKSEIELSDPHHSIVNKYQRKDNVSRFPVAILLHGKRCSSQMMDPLARELARNGVTSYSFDFDGHGNSKVPLYFSCLRSNEKIPICRRVKSDLSLVDSVFQKLVQRENLEGRRIYLIGHSFGGGRIGHALMKSREKSSLDLFLINLDGRENGVVYSGQKLLTLNVTGQRASRAAGRLMELNVSHLGLLISAEVSEIILREVLGDSFQMRERGWVSRSLFSMGPIAVTFLLLIFYFLLLNFLPEVDLKLERRVRTYKDFPLPYLIIILGLAIGSALVCRLSAHIFSLPMIFHTGENLFLLYFVHFGISLWVVHLVYDPLHLIHEICREINGKVVSMVIFSFVLLASIVFSYVDNYLFHAQIEIHRAWRWGCFIFGLLPLGIFVHQLTVANSSVQKWLLRTVIWTIIFSIWLLIAPPRPEDRNPTADVGVYLAFLAISEIFAEKIENKIGSVVGGSIFISLVVAWSAAVFYPIYSY